jgi:hypothetical protein
MKRLIVFIIMCAASVELTAQQSQLADTVYEYIIRFGKRPSEYVVQKFAKNDVVFLAEDHSIKENLDLVTNLIPELYRNGIYTIGMEFGASEDQARMDSLVTAERYDEQIARDMMFDYNVGWAYKEYIEMPKAAWKFNRSLPFGSKKFRIFNMSYIYDWSKFEGKRTPETMAKVFMKGEIDSFRADIIDREIVKKGEKILVLTGTQHAFTKYKTAVFRNGSDVIYHFTEQWLGNILYKKYPGRVFSILLHQPFSNKMGKRPFLLSPGNGVVERAMDMNGNLPAGFDLDQWPPGKIPDSSEFAAGHPDFRLGQLFDGYVFLKPLAKLTGCSIDTLFFKNKRWEDIDRQYPDPDWHKRPVSLSEYWKLITDYVNLKSRYEVLMEKQ